MQADSIEKIFKQIFKKQKEIDQWLFNSIKRWIKTGKIISFAPFETFFSYHQREEDALFGIINQLSEKNSAMLKRAIIKNLKKPNLYISDIEMWSFLLLLVSKLKLKEAIPILESRIKNRKYNEAHKEKGYDLYWRTRDVLYGISKEERYLRPVEEKYLHLSKK